MSYVYEALDVVVQRFVLLVLRVLLKWEEMGYEKRRSEFKGDSLSGYYGFAAYVESVAVLGGATCCVGSFFSVSERTD
ncbi:hypothetical protein ACWODH_04380 [Enterococcus moraviensis]